MSGGVDDPRKAGGGIGAHESTEAERSVPQLTGHLEQEVTMSVMEEQRARTRRSFTDKFKHDAVAMALDDGNKIVDVTERLGVGEGTLGNGCARPVSIEASALG